jgi:hypothetical protein
MKKMSVFVCLVLAIFAIVVAACSTNPAPCTVSAPGVETLKVQFVCPRVGASYEAVALKCPGDETFRVDIACQLCGRHHYYPVRYWPSDYRFSDYFFYGGWFYPDSYWRTYWWPYYYHRPYRWHRSHTVYPPVRPPRKTESVTPPQFPKPRDMKPNQTPPPPPRPQKAQPLPPRSPDAKPK